MFRGEQKILEEAGYCGFGPKMSNNVAEYSGICSILEYLQQEKEPCLISGDSMLVIMHLQRKWRINGGLYMPYYIKARDLYEPIKDRIKLQWVSRDENSICDVLSKGVLRARGIEFRIQREVA